MYYISEDDVAKNLDMKEVVDVLGEVFKSYGTGKAVSTARDRLIYNGTVFNSMPAIVEHVGLAGLKTYIANRKGARFVVLLFDLNAADLVAVIEANPLGQNRTGALPAMVSKQVLRKKNPVFTLIGSGFQAETQLSGMLSAFDISDVRVYSRTFENARKFAEREGKKHGIEIKAYENVEKALDGADVVNTITDSNEAIFSRSALGDEYLVNLAGGNLPFRREVAEDVLEESDLIIVEHLDQAMKESGEIIGMARSHPERKMHELKDIMAHPDLYSGKKRLVFKAMGIGLEDVAAGYLVLKNMGLR